jgi:hypothetical protein
MNDDGNRTLSSSLHCKHNDSIAEKCPSPSSENTEATRAVPICDGGAAFKAGTTFVGHLDPESPKYVQPKRSKTRRGTQINQTATPIPQWIEFETPARVRRSRHVPRPTDGNLMPLSDLAKFMSSQSQIAVDHGLFPSECKDNEQQQMI